tara:strand:+ start:253 stop:399 length:147 start_codon:yes stop_codon:yes gene_type:complete
MNISKLYKKLILFKDKIRLIIASIAQQAEHSAVNRGVVGSSPTGSVFL